MLDLIVTVSTPDALGGYDITGVTGTVGGISVSNFTGTWGTNGDQVSSGLYLNPHQGANPVFMAATDLTFSLFKIRRALVVGTPRLITYFFRTLIPDLDYIGGIALLLSDGASYYLSANCSNPTSCPGSFCRRIGRSGFYIQRHRRHAAPRRSPTLRDRPRRVGSARLAQEAEE